MNNDTTMQKPLVDDYIAENINNITPSITLAITSEAKKLQSQGIKVFSFSAGEPDFATPEHIKEAGIKAIQENKTRYTPATGIPELKAAICEKLDHDNNLKYLPENIVVSCGAKHSIFNCLKALINANAGEEVLIPAPYWVSYPDQVRLVGGVSSFIDTHQTKFKVTPKLLKDKISSKSKVLILNSPSNPTGSVYTKQELEDLVEIIIENNIIVISDEIYEKLVYENTEFVSIASLGQEIFDRTIVVNGFSKAFSMTGWRIGYTASNLSIAKAMNKIQGHMTSNPNTPAQWASIAAIKGGDAAIDTMRLEFDIRRKTMVNLLNSIDGVNCLEPTGAFYAFPNISQLFGKKCDSGIINNSVDFCKLLLKDTNVACVPGSGFGSEGYIRLSYATSLDIIEEGLSRLKNWINSLK
jgi:aspartate aminotransferase